MEARKRGRTPLLLVRRGALWEERLDLCGDVGTVGLEDGVAHSPKHGPLSLRKGEGHGARGERVKVWGKGDEAEGVALAQVAVIPEVLQMTQLVCVRYTRPRVTQWRREVGNDTRSPVGKLAIVRGGARGGGRQKSPQLRRHSATLTLP